MNISSALHYSVDNYQNVRAKSAKALYESRNAGATIQDTVTLSQQPAKKTHTIQSVSLNMPRISDKENAFALGSLRFTSRAWRGQQTPEEAASGWKYYTKPGRITSETDQQLAGERMSLGKEIEGALKNNGIELGEDDKLRISVGKDGKIVIDPTGLSEKNRNKSESIEAALNNVSGLAKNLYLNSAANVINKAEAAENMKPRSSQRSATMGNDAPLFAAAQRESVDEWLQSTFGFGIEDLESEGFGTEEAIGGECTDKFNEYKLSELSFDDGNDLRFTIDNIISNSKKHDAIEFKAVFTYENGILSDNRVSIDDDESSDSANTVDSFKKALQSLNASVAIGEDGALSITGDDKNQIAILVEQAKKNGVYEEFADEISALLASQVDGNEDSSKKHCVKIGEDRVFRIDAAKSGKDSLRVDIIA